MALVFKWDEPMRWANWLLEIQWEHVCPYFQYYKGSQSNLVVLHNRLSLSCKFYDKTIFGTYWSIFFPQHSIYQDLFTMGSNGKRPGGAQTYLGTELGKITKTNKSWMWLKELSNKDPRPQGPTRRLELNLGHSNLSSVCDQLN